MVAVEYMNLSEQTRPPGIPPIDQAATRGGGTTQRPYQIFKFEELLRKTIARISRLRPGKGMVVLFTDNTIAILHYYGPEDCGEFDLCIRCYDDEDLVILGVMSHSEALARKRERERLDAANQERLDREMYERLKKRFEAPISGFQHHDIVEYRCGTGYTVGRVEGRESEAPWRLKIRQKGNFGFNPDDVLYLIAEKDCELLKRREGNS